MRGAAQALTAYYNSFGVEAYHEMTVPDDAQYPYITYNLQESDFDQPVTHYVQVFDRSFSNANVVRIADAIIADIGRGKLLPYDAGLVCLRPSSPLVQLMVEQTAGGPPERRAYINLQLNTFGMPG